MSVQRGSSLRWSPSAATLHAAAIAYARMQKRRRKRVPLIVLGLAAYAALYFEILVVFLLGSSINNVNVITLLLSRIL
jgi:hypothetical protein